MTSFQYIVLMENNIKQNYENTGDLVLSKKTAMKLASWKCPYKGKQFLTQAVLGCDRRMTYALTHSGLGWEQVELLLGTINMKPKHHPIEKEHHLTNHHFQVTS